MFGFISRAQHDAAMFERDNTIADQALLIAKLRKENGRLEAQLRMSERRYEQLDAKLARYIAPRERGEGGRFLPLKRVS